jgi:hypothetical protein
VTFRSAFSLTLVLTLGLALVAPALCACAAEPPAMAGMPCHGETDGGPALGKPCCCVTSAPASAPTAPLALAQASSLSAPPPAALAGTAELSRIATTGSSQHLHGGETPPPLPASSLPRPLRT